MSDLLIMVSICPFTNPADRISATLLDLLSYSGDVTSRSVLCDNKSFSHKTSLPSNSPANHLVATGYQKDTRRSTEKMEGNVRDQCCCDQLLILSVLVVVFVCVFCCQCVCKRSCVNIRGSQISFQPAQITGWWSVRKTPAITER